MKLSKYVKLVKGGGYCMVAHVEDSGIWLGTRSAIFRATELPDMVGEEQVRTVLDMPEKAWEKVHFDERWEGTVKSIFGMNLSDYADGEQDTEKLKVMAAPDGLWCDCRRSMDDGELIFYREAMLSPLAEQIKESDYIRYTVRKMESGQRYLVVHDGFEVLAAIIPVRIVTEKYLKVSGRPVGVSGAMHRAVLPRAGAGRVCGPGDRGAGRGADRDGGCTGK